MRITSQSVMEFFRSLVVEIWQVSSTLFRIMIPTLLVVKVLEELGMVDYLAAMLAPVMALVGLPESMGLVWATTMLTNIYAGMLVFFQMAQDPLTIAQVTVLSGILLVAHGLPVEAVIAQRAGIRLWFTLFIRIGGGLLFGWLLHLFYSTTDTLQQQSVMLWQPDPVGDGLLDWAIAQAESLVMIQLIIIVLLTLLKLLKILGIERVIAWFLRPLLRLLGIGQQAMTITIVGATLGLAFGGGLLIREAQQGHISKQDVFSSMCFLALFHSVIEDTMLVLLLGADLTGVLWFRLLFAVIVVGILTRIVNRKGDAFWDSYLVNRYLTQSDKRQHI